MNDSSRVQYKLRSTRRACDRCYTVKEKCVKPADNATCTRCRRLNLVCQTFRPVRKAGRKPYPDELPSSKVARNAPSSVPLKAIAHPIQPEDRISSTLLRSDPNLLPAEKTLLLFLLSEPDHLEPYVVGRSFTYAEQRSLIALLPTAFPILKDALLACAGVLKRSLGGDTSEVTEDINLSRASSAMLSLRSLLVTNQKEAAVCLALSRLLTTFIYSAVGDGAREVCRHTFTMTGPYMDVLWADPNTGPWINYLYLLEIMECIIHCKRPTSKFQGPYLRIVDRYLGLSLPLLPYYHELCVASHQLHTMPDHGIGARILTRLDYIDRKVEAWQPSQPGDFLQRFDSTEVIHMLAQAKVYRLAALLLSHRLRYKFGEEDSCAAQWSQEVIMELELASHITNRPVHYVALPYIIAAVEITDTLSQVQALAKVDTYADHFIPVVKDQTKSFLLRVWRERDTFESSSWFSCMSKPCVVLHAIDTTLFS
ncbi:hypothetical protein F5884DRAFT_794889 [Xylogone sp. PMI_703]|nr:hypothetical protein F5884DRAFT_794889 [Xylogone sp. PMI_703]